MHLIKSYALIMWENLSIIFGAQLHDNTIETLSATIPFENSHPNAQCEAPPKYNFIVPIQKYIASRNPFIIVHPIDVRYRLELINTNT